MKHYLSDWQTLELFFFACSQCNLNSPEFILSYKCKIWFWAPATAHSNAAH